MAMISLIRSSGALISRVFVCGSGTIRISPCCASTPCWVMLLSTTPAMADASA